MKVINVYDKDSNLKCYGKNIFDTTKEYLSRYPSEYSNCYNHNIKSLELFRVDRMTDETMTGYYDTEANKIFYVNKNSLGHEIFHMASNDLVKNQNAFESKMEIESGLIEGMTEYLAMKAYGLSRPGSYSFEVFCVMMMEDIPNLFKPYFIPNHKEFISLFPNKKDIYSLLYSLNAYNDIELDYLDSKYNHSNVIIDKTILEESIQDTLNNLVNIELSLESDNNMLRIYGDKYMDYLSSNFVKHILRDLYPDYIKYAEKLIKKKIRKKR